jgi:hypothetical protein
MIATLDELDFDGEGGASVTTLETVGCERLTSWPKLGLAAIVAFTALPSSETTPAELVSEATVNCNCVSVCTFVTTTATTAGRSDWFSLAANAGVGSRVATLCSALLEESDEMESELLKAAVDS